MQWRLQSHAWLCRSSIVYLVQCYNSYPSLLLCVWQDTAGQEQFARLTSFYARDAAAAVIAYDLTDRESFDHITKWYRYVQDSRRDVKAKGECVVILAGKRPRDS